MICCTSFGVREKKATSLLDMKAEQSSRKRMIRSGIASIQTIGLLYTIPPKRLNKKASPIATTVVTYAVATLAGCVTKVRRRY